MFRHQMQILIFFQDLHKLYVMVYEIEDDMVVLSKEGKSEYKQNGLVYIWKKKIIMIMQMIWKRKFTVCL